MTLIFLNFCFFVDLKLFEKTKESPFYASSKCDNWQKSPSKQHDFCRTIMVKKVKVQSQEKIKSMSNDFNIKTYLDLSLSPPLDCRQGVMQKCKDTSTCSTIER